MKTGVLLRYIKKSFGLAALDRSILYDQAEGKRQSQWKKTLIYQNRRVKFGRNTLRSDNRCSSTTYQKLARSRDPWSFNIRREKWEEKDEPRCQHSTIKNRETDIFCDILQKYLCYWHFRNVDRIFLVVFEKSFFFRFRFFFPTAINIRSFGFSRHTSSRKVSKRIQRDLYVGGGGPSELVEGEETWAWKKEEGSKRWCGGGGNSKKGHVPLDWIISISQRSTTFLSLKKRLAACFAVERWLPWGATKCRARISSAASEVTLTSTFTESCPSRTIYRLNSVGELRQRLRVKLSDSAALGWLSD